MWRHIYIRVYENLIDLRSCSLRTIINSSLYGSCGTAFHAIYGRVIQIRHWKAADVHASDYTEPPPMRRMMRQRPRWVCHVLQLWKFALRYTLLESEQKETLHSIGRIMWRVTCVHLVFPNDAKQKRKDEERGEKGMKKKNISSKSSNGCSRNRTVSTRTRTRRIWLLDEYAWVVLLRSC